MTSAETISATLESGPGSGSLRSAVRTWSQLQTALEQAAQGVRTQSAQSDVALLGPSGDAMRARLSSYAGDLTALSAYAQRMATAVSSAASAFDVARASAVPLSTITANRTNTARLMAAPDPYGVHLPLIAALQAQYAEMTAHNVAVMQNYGAQSAAAVQSVAGSAAVPPGNVGSFQDFLNGLLGNTESDPVGLLGNLLDSNFFNSVTNVFASGFAPTGIVQDVTSFGFLTAFLATAAADQADDALHDQALLAPPAWLAPILGQMEADGAVAAAAENQVLAEMGNAGKSGLLSVPPSWAQPPPQMGTPRAPLVPPAHTPIGFPTVPFVPVAASPGGVRGRGAPRPRTDPEYGDPPVVMPKHPLGG